MTRPLRLSALILTATSTSTLISFHAHAQVTPQDNGLNQEEEEDIVVTGQRERGAVVGDIKPEQQYNAADIRALGVSNINDLLTELGPQLQSASGKPPVTLLEGHRISSFREIASLPAEAIARVDILPEEVGLRYGYSADQKVMNIVLRQRFRAFTAEAAVKVPTAGQGLNQDFEVGHLSIRRGRRLNLSAEYTHTGDILETDRGLTSAESPARTLSPKGETLTVNGSYNRPVGERTQATLTGEIGTTHSASLVGLAFPVGTIVNGAPAGVEALDRSSSTQSGQIGLTLNAMRSSGQWTLTANYVRQESRGLTDRPFNLTPFAARPSDETQSRQDTANIDFIYNRSLFALPAGDVQATAKLSGAMMRLESDLERDLIPTNRRIGRDSGSGSLNLSFPITAASSGIGRISANANAGVDQLSDAGTLRSFGFGLNWTPKRGINLSASYRDEESAATPSQLGDAPTVTQFVPVFDFVRNESVLVTTITGGNPLLNEARDQNFRLGLNMTVLQEPSLNLSLDYSHRNTRGGITGFPGVSAETAAAFPGRFTRDINGQLTQIDLRPINITEQTRDALRWGINFSKRLKTPQSQINAMREAFQRRFPNGVPPGSPGSERRRGEVGAGQERSTTQGATQGGQGAATGGQSTTADGQTIVVEGRPDAGAGGGPGFAPPGGFGGPGGGRGPGGGASGPGGGGRGFGGFGGGSGGGGGGGRINFAIYHEWTFKNTTQLAPTLPVLDLLDGDSLGNGAGPSRHKIEVQGGISQSGYGLRLNGDWKSTTHSDDLRFGDLATLNLRLFANLTQMPKLVEKAPILRGVRVQLGVDNIFNARQKVTDGAGVVPFAYQAAFIDPIGRTVRLSVRKLFF